MKRTTLVAQAVGDAPRAMRRVSPPKLPSVSGRLWKPRSRHDHEPEQERGHQHDRPRHVRDPQVHLAQQAARVVPISMNMPNTIP